MKKIYFFLILLFVHLSLCAQGAIDYQIIITTPGYTSVYRYDKGDFQEGIVRDFRVQGDISIVEDPQTDQKSLVWLTIGSRQFKFLVSENASVLRLQYDRNRRLFTGLGFNYLEYDQYKYEAPTFKGLSLREISSTMEREINKMIDDRTLLDEDKPTTFILEAEIDEDGFVHRVVELNGSLKQYSKVIIDQFYEQAVRGWEPAKKNGAPYRTIAQIKFELSR